MKAVGAFNADFVQVILLVNTRYLGSNGSAVGGITVPFCTIYITFFLLRNDFFYD